MIGSDAANGPQLSLSPQETLSVYVHIPFCTVKCGYCDFFSVAGVGAGRMEETVRQNLRDLRQFLPMVAPEGTKIRTVYIGGGTPSLLPPETQELLLGELGDTLPGTPEEWTVEANPESLTAESLELLRRYGVDRLSLGIQTLREKGLRSLDRAAGARQTLDSLELLHRRWSGRWSADLIVGYPGDTPARVTEDVATICDLGARHMAVYALTPEEGTPLFAEIAAGRVTLPGDEAVLELLAAAEEALRRRGLRRYEISNYAVPGEESRHNLGYWRLQPYLGVGPGAASTLFEGSGCGEPPATTSGALRLHGVEDITTYIRGHRKRYQGERITPVELLEEQLLMGLRTAEGVPLARLERRFGLSPAAVRGAIAAVPAPVTGERILTVEERPKPALHVPASDWNILDRAVLSAVEALLPLLGEPY